MPEVATRSLPPAPRKEWISALPPAMRFILHGDVGARSAAASVWGVAFAEQSCRAILQGARATLWLGPDEYLLLGGIDGQVATHESQAAETAGALELALGRIPHALVDISHRQFALQVSGPHAATILSGACPLDLDLSEFPVGMCTRTVFAKADIVLWRTQEDVFHVEVWRSFAGYVTGLLHEVAMEVYGT
jgi:sarcosine oxidase subunit gamma